VSHLRTKGFFRHFVILFFAMGLVFGSQVAGASSSGKASSWTTPSASSGCPSTACTAVTAGIVTGLKTQKLPSNLTPTLSKTAADLLLPKGGDCGGFDIKTIYEPCIYGSPTNTSRIAIIGDSKAWQWSTAVNAVAHRTGLSFGLTFQSGCFIALTADKLPPAGVVGQVASPSQCQQWDEAAIRWLNKFKPQTLIVVADGPSDPNIQKIYLKGLKELLQALKAPGRSLVLLGQQPTTSPEGGAICLAAHEQSVQSCTTPLSVALYPALLSSESKVATSLGAKFVNVVPWACTSKGCPAVIKNFSVYEDPYHWTTTYADYLSPLLQKALGLGA
jgi:hypothetical protein